MTHLLRRLETVYPWLLLAPVALPLVVWQGLIYPYLVPKTLLFYALSFVALAVFVLLLTHGRHFYWARLARWESWVPAALLAVAYGTSLMGVDFYRSFWSLLVRGDGLLMFSCVTASFYLLLLSADKALYSRLVNSVAVVGSIVAVYGIGEWLVGGGRIGSLLGNAAFFAGYLGIAVFVTLIAAESLGGSLRTAARTGAALQVVAIVLTATRGTMLALVVALGLALAYGVYALTGRARTNAMRALVALVVVAGLFFAARTQLMQLPFEPVARIASVSRSDNDVSSRLFVWQHMLTEIEKSPVFGVGAEHIDVLFNRFYDPSKISEQWFDRSHNAYLDYWAQFGILGVLLYGSLIAAFFATARRLKQLGHARTALLLSLLAVTYAAQNFFVFDTVSSLWLLIALLALSIASAHEGKREELPLPVWMKTASWFIALALVAFIYPVSMQPARAAYNLAHSYSYQLVDVSRSVSYLNHGFAFDTYANLEYGYQAYDMYSKVQIKIPGDARATAYQATLALLKTNFTRYSYDARTALYLAHTLSLAPAGVSIDSDLLATALDRAIKYSPKRAQPWYIIANLLLTQANTFSAQSKERLAGYAAAKGVLDKYLAQVPELSTPHFVLAQLLLASGDTAGATAEAAKGKAYYRGDLEAAERAVGYYETVFDLPSAAYFLTEILKNDPSNAAAKADLDKINAYEQSKR